MIEFRPATLRWKHSSPEVINDVVYDSIVDAMAATGLERHTITNRCKSDKFPNYERL